MSIYKINTPILLNHVSKREKENLTDFQLTLTDPNGLVTGPFTLTYIDEFNYQVTWTPNVIGKWIAKIESVFEGSSEYLFFDVIDPAAAVNVTIPDSSFVQSRVEQPVHKGDFNNTSINKIEYVVPTNKTLYITTLSTAIGCDGDTIVIGWQVDTVDFHIQTVSEEGSQYNNGLFIDGNPLGPFNSGTIIRARRIEGDSGKKWSASFTGYLEDV